MAFNPVMRAIALHWNSVEARLTAAEARRFRALVQRFAAPGATAGDRLQAIEDLADMLLRALPADHPVRRAIADPDSFRSDLVVDADYAIIEELRRLLEPQMRQLFGPAAAAGRDRGAAGAGSADARSPQGIERDAMARLADAPAMSVQDLRKEGGDPGQRHLIRLDGRDGPRFPLFQFDAAGRPLRLVLRINALLDADTDPWGVADWWLGANPWLGQTPAESIGRVADEVLLATARAMVEAE